MLSHTKESLETATVPYNICFAKILNILTMRGILKKIVLLFTTSIIDLNSEKFMIKNVMSWRKTNLKHCTTLFKIEWLKQVLH